MLRASHSASKLTHLRSQLCHQCAGGDDRSHDFRIMGPTCCHFRCHPHDCGNFCNHVSNITMLVAIGNRFSAFFPGVLGREFLLGALAWNLYRENLLHFAPGMHRHCCNTTLLLAMSSMLGALETCKRIALYAYAFGIIEKYPLG